LDEKRRQFIDKIFQKLGKINRPITIPIA